MTDDLVKAIARAWASIDGKPYGTEEAEEGGYTEGYNIDAEELVRRSGLADRIEELEAKLAKAVGSLDIAATALNRVAWGGDFTCFVDAEWQSVNNALDDVRTTLAELTGGKE